MRLPQDRILHIDSELAGDEVRVVAEWQGEIVRCKDCRHWQEQEEGIVECSVCTRIHDMVFEMGADGFCSYGERKGGDDE